MHALPGAIDGRENPPRLFEHDVAGHREGDPPGRAVQQLRPDGRFELRDLVRHGRLRKIAEARGAREVSQLGDGHEGLQLCEVH